jgi:HEPN domain-containing protein
MNHAGDWLRQAERELAAAEVARGAKLAFAACFFCHQAAEKALKAGLERRRAFQRGHDLLDLVAALAKLVAVPQAVVDCAARLNMYYTDTRYPQPHLTGAPADRFVDAQAVQAIADAQEVIAFAKSVV